jgi:hypothetical protein
MLATENVTSLLNQAEWQYLHACVLLKTEARAEALQVLESVYRKIMAVADKFTIPDLRRDWLENRLIHRQIVAAWEQYHDGHV